MATFVVWTLEGLKIYLEDIEQN